MQRLKIREDLVFLRQDFYDEEFQLLKALTTVKIQRKGDRLFSRVWKMQKADVGNSYTLLQYKEIAFDQELSHRLFTTSSLTRPGR
jgi:hypothetical protein